MSRSIQRSRELFATARQHIPGGVNSPVRSFRAVGGQPLFIESASGSRVIDVDGNAYIDYVLSWGPLILGHAHPDVVRAVRDAAGRGTSYGAPTAAEIELATLVKRCFPSIELVRMVNSGTEATMSAIRLARAFTGRRRVIKFAGCYHGHSDGLLVRAGSGATDIGVPDSPGVPDEIAGHTLSLPFNDLEAARKAFERFADDIACVIVEPVPGNMGLVLPRDGYLQGLRELTARAGALLVFDEVMTGFRVAPGGAQELYRIRPDLTTLGKVIGGGLPVGAYGGRRDVMEMVAPLGPVYQAGTLSGNPLAMAAGIATLKRLLESGAHETLTRRTERLARGLAAAARDAGYRYPTTSIGAMFGLFFTDAPVYDYESALRADLARFRTFFLAMLDEGVYLAPSQFEAGFTSLAHTDADVDATVAAAERAFRRVRGEHG